MSAPTDPADPLYWPESAAYGNDAIWHDAHWYAWPNRGWAMATPPPGFPFMSPPYDRATFGPPGVGWIFTEAQMMAGLAGLPDQPTRAAINFALKKFGAYLGAGSLLWWNTPQADDEEVGGMAQSWIRSTIVGELGVDESVAHVLNFKHSTDATTAPDAAAVKAFGNTVAAKWALFLAATGAGGRTMASYLPNELKYTEVRSAWLTQAAPGPWLRRLPHGGREYVDGAKPVWAVPTQYSPIAGTGMSGTGTTPSMPYEVALCITHGTNFRGPRFRGRTYLGPLMPDLMQEGGVFYETSVGPIGVAFGDFLHAIELATDWECHIVSQKYATSAKVIGTKVGRVPDSQRRRRRSQAENSVLVAGLPVGSS